MSKFKRCLIWYSKHYRFFDFLSIVGWLLFPAFVLIGSHLDCSLWFLFLWYLIFEVVPLAFLSVLLELCIKKLDFAESDS